MAWTIRSQQAQAPRGGAQSMRFSTWPVISATAWSDPFPPGSTTIDATHAVYHCLGDGSFSSQCALTDILSLGSHSPISDGRWGQADLEATCGNGTSTGTTSTTQALAAIAPTSPMAPTGSVAAGVGTALPTTWARATATTSPGTVLRRRAKRPKTRRHEPVVMVLLTAFTRTWREAVLLVKRSTVLRWHRAEFRLFWRHKSSPRRSTPGLAADTIGLIKCDMRALSRQRASRMSGPRDYPRGEARAPRSQTTCRPFQRRAASPRNRSAKADRTCCVNHSIPHRTSGRSSGARRPSS
jgi:hypothetical protein